MFGLESDVVAILAAVAFFAGAIDAIAGGGGLLTLPAILLTGIDPLSALATNKVQGTFGSGSATWAFVRTGHIHWHTSKGMALAACAGAVLGTGLVNLLPVQVLQVLMPILLVVMAIYFALSPRLSEVETRARLTPMAFTFGIAFPIGFYDGIFGPGTGSFFMLAFLTLFGFGILKATAHTKLLNFASNIGSLGMFAVSGKILWPLGILMGIGQLVGAQLGARLAVRHGASIIRPLLICVCIGMAVRLMWNPDNPLRAFLSQIIH